MAAVSDNRALKEKRILDCALRILTAQGDAALTMRKIAECAEMRLSNVQYYFKAKDDVLLAMVHSYFGACAEELGSIAAANAALDQRERARRLIAEVLKHGTEVSDMCRVFREIWAISTRNDVIRQRMMDYYATFASTISQSILGDQEAPALEARLGTLLVPFFEGYSITAPALSMRPDEVTEMVTDLAMSVINEA